MCQSEMAMQEHEEWEQKKQLPVANPYPQAIKDMIKRLAMIGYLEGVIDSHVKDLSISTTCKDYLKEMVALITKG